MFANVLGKYVACTAVIIINSKVALVTEIGFDITNFFLNNTISTSLVSTLLSVYQNIAMKIITAFVWRVLTEAVSSPNLHGSCHLGGDLLLVFTIFFTMLEVSNFSSNKTS